MDGLQSLSTVQTLTTFDSWVRQLASADVAGISEFPELLKARIEERGYSPKQVINFDEMGLFWKMSSRTFIAKEEKVAFRVQGCKGQLNTVFGW